MKQQVFLESYLKYIPKTITIIHYSDSNTYSFNITKKMLRPTKKEFFSSSILKCVITDYFDLSQYIKIKNESTYNDDMNMLEIINDKGIILRLVSYDLKKSFPFIYKNLFHNHNTSFVSNEDVIKIKELITTGKIKNIIIKEDSENYLKIKEKGSTSFEKNYDMDGILKIKCNNQVDNKCLDNIVEIIECYYWHNKKSLINAITLENSKDSNKRYILTFNNGIIYVRSNLIYNRLLDIREVNLKRQLTKKGND